jgi:hypothetical protein
MAVRAVQESVALEALGVRAELVGLATFGSAVGPFGLRVQVVTEAQEATADMRGVETERRVAMRETALLPARPARVVRQER